MREAAVVTERLTALTRLMRAEGARAGMGEVLAGHRALAAVDPASRTDAYYALRAALCSSRAELAAFDAAFAAVFAPPESDEPPVPLEELAALPSAALPQTKVPAPPERSAEAEIEPVPAAWSEVELLRTKDFAAISDAERAAAHALITRLAQRAPRRISRRTRPTRRRRELHDLRATVRASLRHGGELMERRYRTPTERPRRLVLVCDVSGSMAPYARMLLQYLQACVAARRRVEAFVFGTRLTRLTRELAGRDPERALQRATDHVVDMAGGTRIGASLAELNREHGRRMGRGVDRRDPLRRLGPGRPGRAGRGDGAPAALRVPRDVAQPAGRRPALRAADPRHARRAAARGPPVARQLDRLAGGTGRSDGGGTDMKDVLSEVDAWAARGDAVALATVVGVKRSAPRPPGAKMAVNEHGEICGAVSGGCVEGAVVEVAEEVLAGSGAAAAALRHRRRGGLGRRAAVRRRDRRLGGALRAVSAAQHPQGAFTEAARADDRAALVTVLAGASPGAKLLVRPDGSRLGSLGDGGARRHRRRACRRAHVGGALREPRGR